MITRYDVGMNGVSLSTIDDTIFVTDIREKDPKQSIDTVPMINGGTRYLRTNRTSVSIEVRFAIREYDPFRRRLVCSHVREWARRGFLSTSDRPGQRIRVVCEKLPTVDSALKWTADLDMQFTAYEKPYWEADIPYTYTLANGENSVMPPGDMTGNCTADLFVSALGPINSMSIRTPVSAIQFEGLDMIAGDKMSFEYDNTGLINIRINGEPSLGKRTANSSDDLFLEAGKVNNVVLTCDGNADVTIRTRGRYD